MSSSAGNVTGSVSSHKAGSWQRNRISLQNDFARLSRCAAAPQLRVNFMWLLLADGLISGGTLRGQKKAVASHVEALDNLSSPSPHRVRGHVRINRREWGSGRAGF